MIEGIHRTGQVVRDLGHTDILSFGDEHAHMTCWVTCQRHVPITGAAQFTSHR